MGAESIGAAWDGLAKYDLAKYNAWYFERLREFASHCDRKGVLLLHNFYMQHALLETNAHYVDFPWRPANCLQQTDMPDHTPAANVFYDVDHPLRRKLHEAYIRKCLDELGDYSNVIHLCSEEFTGPLSFMQFWLDTVFQWEADTGKDVHVALSATKDVMDAVLADRKRQTRISTIDLPYLVVRTQWKALRHPRGRRGRGPVRRNHHSNNAPADPPASDAVPAEVSQASDHLRACRLAATCVGRADGRSSLQVGQLPYPEKSDPTEYISPEVVSGHPTDLRFHSRPTGRRAAECPACCRGSGAVREQLVFGESESHLPGLRAARREDPRQHGKRVG